MDLNDVEGSKEIEGGEVLRSLWARINAIPWEWRELVAGGTLARVTCVHGVEIGADGRCRHVGTTTFHLNIIEEDPEGCRGGALRAFGLYDTFEEARDEGERQVWRRLSAHERLRLRRVINGTTPVTRP